jgi:hypothetical protein
MLSNKRLLGIMLIIVLLIGLLALIGFYLIYIKAETTKGGFVIKPTSQMKKVESPIPNLPENAYSNIVNRSYCLSWKRPPLKETGYIPTKYIVKVLDKKGNIVASKEVEGSNEVSFSLSIINDFPILQENETYWWTVDCLYFDNVIYSFVGGGFTLNEINEPPTPPLSGFKPVGQIEFDKVPANLVFEWNPSTDPDPGDSIKNYEFRLVSDDGKLLVYKHPKDTFLSIPSKSIAKENAVIRYKIRAVDSKGMKSEWSSEQTIFFKPPENEEPVEHVTPEPVVHIPEEISSEEILDYKKRLLSFSISPSEYLTYHSSISLNFSEKEKDLLNELNKKGLKPSYVLEIFTNDLKTKLLNSKIEPGKSLPVKSIAGIDKLPVERYFLKIGIKFNDKDELLYTNPIEYFYLGYIEIQKPSKNGDKITPDDKFKWERYIGPGPEYKDAEKYIVKIAKSKEYLEKNTPIADKLFIIETNLTYLDFYKRVAYPLRKDWIYEGSTKTKWFIRVSTEIYKQTVHSEIREFYFTR